MTQAICRKRFRDGSGKPSIKGPMRAGSAKESGCRGRRKCGRKWATENDVEDT